MVMAGGRGIRLGTITEFVSKPFVPVVDRPVFLYGVAQLRASPRLREIVVLTNADNDAAFRRAGFSTVVQDDDVVHDMFSGWRYLKAKLDSDGPAVLVPCDNVSDIAVDRVVDAMLTQQADAAFSVTRVSDRRKLENMGVYDPASGAVHYRPAQFVSDWGVIAPYAVRAGFEPEPATSDAEVFNAARVAVIYHEGYWFDIGDPESLVSCTCSLAAILAANR